MAQIATHFDERTCREAARIGLNFFELNGFRFPCRIRVLIEQLATEHFLHEPLTEASRIDFCDRLKAAAQPWRG